MNICFGPSKIGYDGCAIDSLEFVYKMINEQISSVSKETHDVLRDPLSDGRFVRHIHLIGCLNPERIEQLKNEYCQAGWYKVEVIKVTDENPNTLGMAQYIVDLYESV